MLPIEATSCMGERGIKKNGGRSELKYDIFDIL
jgi:hypothetical protein